MKKDYPSIFNDVIGPVMRGPSSSHCAAAVRIGRISRDLMDGELAEISVTFDEKGSLATTHESQGSDMGLFAGLLGWEPTDERMVTAPQAIKDAGIRTSFSITDFGAKNPNTYKLVLRNAATQHEVTAVSTGGGGIEITEIDGIQLSIAGDYFETLLFIDSDGHKLLATLTKSIKADEINLLKGKNKQLIQIKAHRSHKDEISSDLRSKHQIKSLKVLSPVLPVLSHRQMTVPFLTCEEMLRYNEDRDLDLWKLVASYEEARGKLSQEQVLQRMKDIVRVMRQAIEKGIHHTEYGNRILGSQSPSFKKHMEGTRLLDAGMLNRMILYVTATMEVKSSFGVIVAAPTAGSCGVLPGAILGAATAMGLSDDDSTKAMLVAGIIGVFILAKATFAAEIGGCQAECGTASGMAAAALVVLAGGTTKQAVAAASMALQNVLGMVCDPVANRVEVPCLGKNVMAASNALSSANMALADFDAVLPLDEVIEAMDKVGKSLPHELRCTALGGLSVTKTSKEIAERLT